MASWSSNVLDSENIAGLENNFLNGYRPGQGYIEYT